jgi:hypothetical protein
VLVTLPVGQTVTVAGQEVMVYVIVVLVVSVPGPALLTGADETVVGLADVLLPVPLEVEAEEVDDGPSASHSSLLTYTTA